MSFCVNCGVELHATARGCPLCSTPVVNPVCPPDTLSPLPYPRRRTEVGPTHRGELALLITAMLGSVAICCGLLNLVFKTDRWWSLYFIGASSTIWVFFVPPLLWRKLPFSLRILLDVGAVAVYVYLIAIDLNGRAWYFGLALPIIVLAGAILLALYFMLRGARHSILTTTTILIAALGVFVIGIDLMVDRYLRNIWVVTWSLVIVTVCVALIIPLLIVRHNPSLREEVRRRLHL